MKWTAAAAALLAAGAGGALLVAVACIPDLPDVGSAVAEASVDAPVVDVGAEVASPAHPRCGDGIIQLDRNEQCDPGGNVPADAAADVTYLGCNATCEFVCPGYLWPNNNHCYTLAEKLTSVLDPQASVSCEDIGLNAHVVTFASEAELSAVVGALDAGNFWVGFVPALSGANQYTSLALFEPGWSPTCPGCFAHVADAGAPLPGATQGCVEALSNLDASWQQYPCSDGGKLHVVCEREPTGLLSQKCDGGVCIDLVWTHSQKRYVYVGTKLDGNGAEKECASLGGTLVVLQSRDEREQLWHELGHMGGTPGSIWIGLSRTGSEWIWDDDAGLDAYPSPWGDKQPSGNASRAYLLQTLMPPTPLDTTLGRNDVNVVSTKLFSVCQVPATDGGL